MLLGDTSGGRGRATGKPAETARIAAEGVEVRWRARRAFAPAQAL
jgi:hypothetical protein